MYCLLADELQQQNGYQGRPDLGAYGILASTNKCLDAQQLLDHLKKDFDLSPHLIESSRRCRIPVSLLSQQLNKRLHCRVVVHRHSANQVGISARGLLAYELDSFIEEKILSAGIGLIKRSQTSVLHGLLKSSNKTKAHAVPISQQLCVTVTTVRDNDTTELRHETISSEMIRLPYRLRCLGRKSLKPNKV